MTVDLFPEPEKETLELSAHFGATEFELGPRMRVSYLSHTFKQFTPCEECQWRMHELRGRGPQYRQVYYARVLKRPADKSTKDWVRIELCREHARLWKERDGVSY